MDSNTQKRNWLNRCIVWIKSNLNLSALLLFLLLCSFASALAFICYAAFGENPPNTVYAAITAAIGGCAAIGNAMVQENKRNDENENNNRKHEFEDKKYRNQIFGELTKELYNTNYSIRYNSVVRIKQFYETVGIDDNGRRMKKDIADVLVKYLATSQPDKSSSSEDKKEEIENKEFKNDLGVRKEIIVFLSKIAGEEAKKFEENKEYVPMGFMEKKFPNKNFDHDDKGEEAPWVKEGVHKAFGVDGSDEKCHYLIIPNAQLCGIDLIKEKIQNIYFEYCIFTGSDFVYTRFENTIFASSLLNNCYFNHSEWERTLCRYISFDHSDFSNVKINDSEFCYVFFNKWSKSKVKKLKREDHTDAYSVFDDIIHNIFNGETNILPGLIEEDNKFPYQLTFSLNGNQYLYSYNKNIDLYYYDSYRNKDILSLKDNSYLVNNYDLLIDSNHNESLRTFRQPSISNSLFWGCSFDGLKISDNLLERSQDSSKADFEDVSIWYSTFYKSDLNSLKFKDCELRKVTFNFSNLDMVEFEGEKPSELSILKTNDISSSFLKLNLSNVMPHLVDEFFVPAFDCFYYDSSSVNKFSSFTYSDLDIINIDKVAKYFQDMAPSNISSRKVIHVQLDYSARKKLSSIKPEPQLSVKNEYNIHFYNPFISYDENGQLKGSNWAIASTRLIRSEDPGFPFPLGNQLGANYEASPPSLSARIESILEDYFKK